MLSVRASAFFVVSADKFYFRAFFVEKIKLLFSYQQCFSVQTVTL